MTVTFLFNKAANWVSKVYSMHMKKRQNKTKNPTTVQFKEGEKETDTYIDIRIWIKKCKKSQVAIRNWL